MSGWGNTNSAASAPSYKILATNKANGQSLYQNVTVGAFGSNEVEQLLDVNAANTALLPGGQTAGWNLVKYGTGPVTNITITTGGSAYSNTTDYVTFVQSSNASITASANLVTNATGGITGITNLVTTSGFTNTSTTTTTIHTTGGTGGAVVPVLSGRAGRTTYECLVAIGSIA